MPDRPGGNAAATRLIDGRDMEPPEPLERTLAELDTLGADEMIVLLVRCEPVPLYTMLRREGYRYDSRPTPDGANEVHIWKD